MSPARTQNEVAADLARYLTEKDSWRGNEPPPLEQIVRAKINDMTREIAAEVIAATPELRAHVKSLTEEVVRKALRKDSWLNQTIVSAVSKALTDLALERSEP